MLSSCGICWAEVREDNYDSHQQWHEDIRDFINAQVRGWS